MAEQHGTLALVRLSGELTTKSRRTRRRFQRRLVTNLEDALSSTGAEFEVGDEWGRIFVRASNRAVLNVIPRVFGIVSVSEVEATCQPELAAILATGGAMYADRVRGGTFAVRARRSGSHPFSSRDVNYELGAILNRNAEVDLENPDLCVQIEIREDTTYFFTETIHGAAGLPLGVEGSAVALISGGYDSAVAAWMMLRRGVALDYVFCNLAGGAYERAVLAVAKALADEWSYGTWPRIHVVDFDEPVDHLQANVPRRFWQVVLKRLMLRTADAVARETGGQGIVTGESIGQVSSQTLSNLSAIGQAVETPVLRPLLGFTKEEIIARSREIGSYALSERVREYCALVEDRPVTETTAAAAEVEEAKLDLSVVDRAVRSRKVLDLRALSASDLVMPYLRTAEIGADAAVIDTRSQAEYDAWHYPGSTRRDYWVLFRNFRKLERDRTYVLYCDIGLKTANLAEKMQRAGYEAYSFKGGVRALREYAASRRPDLQAARRP